MKGLFMKNPFLYTTIFLIEFFSKSYQEKIIGDESKNPELLLILDLGVKGFKQERDNTPAIFNFA